MSAYVCLKPYFSSFCGQIILFTKKLFFDFAYRLHSKSDKRFNISFRCMTMLLQKTHFLIFSVLFLGLKAKAKKMPPDVWSRVNKKLTLSQIKGSLGSWLERNPHLLQNAISLSLLGLKTEQVTQSASFALKDIINDCELSAYADQIIVTCLVSFSVFIQL